MIIFNSNTAKEFKVQVADDDWEGVKAERVHLQDGALIFYHDSKLVIAYGPKSWMAVFPE